MALGHAQRAGTHLFQCIVQGEPLPTVRWVKNGVQLEEDDRFWFHHSEDGLVSMVISGVTLADSGHYQCIAENSEGVAVSSSWLNVKGIQERPGTPHLSVQVMEFEESLALHGFCSESPGTSPINLPPGTSPINLSDQPVSSARCSESPGTSPINLPPGTSPINLPDQPVSSARTETLSTGQISPQGAAGVPCTGNTRDLPPGPSLVTSLHPHQSQEEDHRTVSNEDRSSTPTPPMHASSPPYVESAVFEEFTSHLQDDSGYFENSLSFFDSYLESPNHQRLPETSSLSSGMFSDQAGSLQQPALDQRQACFSSSGPMSNTEQPQADAALYRTDISQNSECEFTSPSAPEADSTDTHRAVSDKVSVTKTHNTRDLRNNLENTNFKDVNEETTQTAPTQSTCTGSDLLRRQSTGDTHTLLPDVRDLTTSNEADDRQTSEVTEPNTTWVEYLDSQAGNTPDSRHGHQDGDPSPPASEDRGGIFYGESTHACFGEESQTSTNMPFDPKYRCRTVQGPTASCPSEYSLTEANHRDNNNGAFADSRELLRQRPCEEDTVVGQGLRREGCDWDGTSVSRPELFSDIWVDEVRHNSLETEWFIENQRYYTGDEAAPSPVSEATDLTESWVLPGNNNSRVTEPGRQGQGNTSQGPPSGETNDQYLETIRVSDTEIGHLRFAAAVSESAHSQRQIPVTETRDDQTGQETVLHQPPHSSSTGIPGNAGTHFEEVQTTEQTQFFDMTSIELLGSSVDGEATTNTYRISSRSRGAARETTRDEVFSMSDIIRTVLEDGAEMLRFTATMQIPQFVQPPEDVTVAASGTIVLTCEVRGYPDPQVTWAKDEERSEVKASHRVFLSRHGDVHRLEIRSAGPSDSGQYICTASNSEGQITATVTVTVGDASPSTSASQQSKTTVKDDLTSSCWDCGETEEAVTVLEVEETEEAVTVLEVDEKEDKGDEDAAAVDGDLSSDAAHSVTVSSSSSSSSSSSQESRTVRYAKLVGMAAAFSLVVLGANKAFNMIKK